MCPIQCIFALKDYDIKLVLHKRQKWIAKPMFRSSKAKLKVKKSYINNSFESFVFIIMLLYYILFYTFDYSEPL